MKICKNCTWYFPLGNFDHVGACHLHGPICGTREYEPASGSAHPGNVGQLLSRWPVVGETNGCGDFLKPE